MSPTQFTGTINFKVAGQEAISKWMQTALKDALDNADAPPEALRFQCRIASDARTNFAHIDLADGESLSLHPKARPQFGKDSDGNAYLTVTMIYSADGESYKIRWAGNAVPRKMQEIAVQHDQGVAVKPATVKLDLALAQVTPSWKGNKSRRPTSRDYREESAQRRALREAGVSPAKRAKRNCARLTESDVSA